MKSLRGVLPAVIVLAWCTGAAAAVLAPVELDAVPPAFAFSDGKAVPIDIEHVDITYDFDVVSRKAHATAVMAFRALQPGYPMFDLVPAATDLKFDNQPAAPDLLKLVSDPDNVTHVRVFQRKVDDAAQHTLTIVYDLSPDDVTFSSGTVRTAFHMSDLPAGGRNYFEQYGPANFEFDQVIYRFHVRVTGAGAEHVIFTNGTLKAQGPAAWSIDFPPYFTASSIFFHLTEAGRYRVTNFEYQGLERKIPVTVYSSSDGLTRQGVDSARKVLAENEQTYGPFVHEHLVIYVTDGGGGMEYCGATTASLRALGHELTHSWFARGVMPAEGNAGWIDEAVASWRDNGYPRASSGPTGGAVNLGGFSPYRRHTPTEAYRRGARLISEFDFLFKDRGGMKAVLRQLYAARKRTAISVHYFESFLKSASGQDITDLFKKYVYGQTTVGGVPMIAPERTPTLKADFQPQPFDRRERALFR